MQERLKANSTLFIESGALLLANEMRYKVKYFLVWQLSVMLQNKIVFMFTFRIANFLHDTFHFEIMTFRYDMYTTTIYVLCMCLVWLFFWPLVQSMRQKMFIISQWIDKRVEGSTEHRLTWYTSTRAVGLGTLGSHRKKLKCFYAHTSQNIKSYGLSPGIFHYCGNLNVNRTVILYS